MKKTFFLTIMAGMIILATSCATGKKALQQGNYAEAVLTAVGRLRDNPSSKNSAETLQEAYPLAISIFKEEIDQLLQSRDPFRFGGIVDRYEKMNKMGDEIRHCPAALKVIKNPEMFGEQLAETRQKAAPEAYDAGVNLQKQGTRQAAKEAYYQFLNADRFVPGFQDVRKKIEQSKFDATLKVVVEQVSVPGRYKISSDFFYDQVYSFLSSGVRQEFVQFYDPKTAKELPYVDEVLTMQFEDFVVGSTSDRDSEKEFTSKDSVKIGTGTVNGAKVDVFDRVKAKLTTHRREVVSTGLLSIQILDARTNKPRASQKLPGTYTWVSEWANYNGDERALTPQQLELCKRKPMIAPPPQDLFLEFTRPIFDQLKSFLRNQYRNS